MNDIVLQVNDSNLTMNSASQQLKLAFIRPPKPNMAEEDALQLYGKKLYEQSIAHLKGVLESEGITRVFVDDTGDSDWELLHDGENFLCLTQLSLIRYSKQASPQALSLAHAPLRILYTKVAQSPPNIDEERLLKDLADRSEGRIELSILRNPSKLRLSQVLDEAQANQKPFHLWHYSGELHNDGLLFADSSVLSLAQLEKLLRTYSDLRLLLLNLSNTGIQGTSFTKLPLAFVLAPKTHSPAEYRHSFLETWYQRLLHEGLSRAILQARQKSYQFSFGENAYWASFALYGESRDDLIFAPSAPLNLSQLPGIAQLKRDQVFVSYSHRDKIWCDRLMGYLDPLRQSHTIKAWVDTDIEVGSDWYKDIKSALARAKVAILLASPEFFRSSFIQKDEFPVILAARQAGHCTVIWVAVSAYPYELTPLTEIQAAHPPNEPLDRLSDTAAQDVLLTIARLVAAALKEN